MEKKNIEFNDSHITSNSRITESIHKKDEELEQSLQSLSWVFHPESKSHEKLRNERISELNTDFEKCLLEKNYEKGIIITKKLIFFEPSSKEFLFLYNFFIEKVQRL